MDDCKSSLKEDTVGGHLPAAAGVFAALWIALTPARAQVTKENVDGIVNFHRLETTIACSGAIKPGALPNIKKIGFVSVINLREPTEPGANVVEEGEAAKAAGLRYYSIPFNANAPDPTEADKFLDAITMVPPDQLATVPVGRRRKKNPGQAHPK